MRSVRISSAIGLGTDLNDGLPMLRPLRLPFSLTCASAAFVREHGLNAFCRVLFNSNEFLYVD